MYTTSTAFIEALQEAGVSYIFANLGSDHPGFIEAMASAKATGKPVPKLITCPNEMVALSAAQGYAQITGRAQAVVVHVECGTQSLGGAVHNAARGRSPVLIFAGASPFTQESEMRGTRSEFIHWLQDVFDQRGIVRGYVKYNNELRTGRNIKQMVHRALQFANTDPKGPVYLMAAREVMEEEVPPVTTDVSAWNPIEPTGLPPAGAQEIVRDLIAAKRPLIVTSYVGRIPEAVDELVRLAERLGIGVLESVPNHMNFPSDHSLYLGNQGNEPHQNPALAEADVVLLVDTDVPWIPKVNKPSSEARIYHIDIDPLKEQMPLWYIPTAASYRADATTALRQLNELLNAAQLDPGAIQARCMHYRRKHEEREEKLREREKNPGEKITAEFLTACVRRHIDRDAVILNETITNYTAVTDHIGCTRPLTRFTSGASSLGWNGGASFGMKLAHPEKTVVCLTGDGSYLFSQPSTVHWMARRYQAPFLTVVYNNQGWKAPKMSTLSVHPKGCASQADDIGVAFDPVPDYAGIAAAAGGAFARSVRRPEDLDEAVQAALHAVREEKRAAVLDVWLAHL